MYYTTYFPSTAVESTGTSERGGGLRLCGGDNVDGERWCADRSW